MSNTIDTIAYEIISDKTTWETSGKEDFRSLLEAVSMEVDDEINERRAEEIFDTCISFEDEFNDEEVSSLMSESYEDSDIDMFEES